MDNFQIIANEAVALGASYSEAKAAAYTHDPNLTLEAMGEQVSARLMSAAEEFGHRFDALLSRALVEAETVRAAALRARPVLDASDSAAMVRTEQAWSHNVRPLLERGKTLSEALATGGLDEAMGAQRFAGSWLAQNATGADAQDPVAIVGQAVTEAFARLAATHAQASAIVKGQSVERDLSVVRKIVGHSRTGNTLEAAITVQYAGLGQPDQA